MDWDVIVVGLGTAGAAAALGAARLGLRVLGVERATAMGGQETCGCISFGARTPADKALALERDADRLGVARAYEATPCAVRRDGRRLTALTFVADGRLRTERARVFIDATGNATVARLAGLPVRAGRPGDGATARAARADLWTDGARGCRPRYTNHAVSVLGGAARYAAAAQTLADARAAELGAAAPGGETLLQAATLVGAREEARYTTETIVAFHDLLTGGGACPNALFHGFGPEDYVTPDGPSYARESDDIQNWKALCHLAAFGLPYAIPYGAIVAKGIDNLLTPSKHLGVTHDAGGTVRLQPEMRKSGGAAACAAKVLSVRGGAARDVPYADLEPLLRREGCLTKPRKRTVDTVNGFSFGRPFTDDDIAAALARPVERGGEWWNATAADTPALRAAYAYWSCWQTALTGTADAARRRADRLAAALAAARTDGGAAAGNFAVALGLMGDRRGLDTLRALVRTPGGAADPAGPRIYPNRLKAIPLLGRFADAAARPLLREIVRDGAAAFTADMPAKGVFASRDACRREAVALAEAALARIDAPSR